MHSGAHRGASGFSSDVLEAVAISTCICVEMQAAMVLPIHLAAALLLDASGPVADLVGQCDADPEAIYDSLLADMESQLADQEEVENPVMSGEVQVGPCACGPL